MRSYRILEVELQASLAFTSYCSGQIHAMAPLPQGIIVMDPTEKENHLLLPGNRNPVTCPISSSGVLYYQTVIGRWPQTLQELNSN